MLGRSGFNCATRLPTHFLRRQQVLRLSVNNLYSPAALGVTNFENARDRVKHQFQHLEDKFKDKMKEFSDPASISTTIFTEDLKHMVHLAGEEDIPLLKQMVIKFAKQNENLRFGSFVFGPVVMRLFYSLNRPLEALDLFNNPDLGAFFDQLVTFQILMDLLLKNGLYDEVLSVFEVVMSKQLQGAKYPKNVVVLVFGACYKKNDKGSLEYSKKLWSELNSVGHYPMRRAATFASALAINQGEPAVAIEMLTNVKRQSYVTVRNLKVMALADLGRPDDAFPVLRNVLEFRDAPDGQVHTFYRETIDKMEAAVRKLKNPEALEDFDGILSQLNSLKLIIDVPLDDQLCADIEMVKPVLRDGGQPGYHRDFRSAPFKGRQGPNQRPGVMNIV